MTIKKTLKYTLIALLGIIFFYFSGRYLSTLNSKSLDELDVVLSARVIEDDVFQLFYVAKEGQKFKISRSIKTKVEGSKEYQNIKFRLPKIKTLHKLRLDIGTNPNQKPITIKGVEFIKKNQKYIFDIKQFNNLFKPNNYIKKEKIVGVFKGVSALRKSKKIYDPYFVSRKDSKELEMIKIQKLTHYPYLISGFVSLVLFFVVIYNLNRVSISSQAVFIASFFLMLILPTIQKTIPFTKELKNIEKRKLAKKPEFSFKNEYSKDYEAYYNDNFGLRNNLINWGGAYRTRFYRSSMHPELVKFGKNDWLFYNRMVKGRIFKSYTNTNLHSEKMLKEVVDKWEENKQRYEAKGRKYFLSFWPNKHTIYPEHLPLVMKAQIKDTVSRIDQILSYLKKRNSPVKLLDPRGALIEGKKKNPVYQRFDTHWNDYGAFLGYQKFFNENREALGIAPKRIKDFDITWEDRTEGGLIKMLGVKNTGFFIEKAPKFTLKENKDQIEFLSIEGFPKQTKITRNVHCGNKLKVLVFRDSFTSKLIQFFSLHFYEVTYIWGHGEKYVNRLQPDIIIEGYVERGTAQKVQ